MDKEIRKEEIRKRYRGINPDDIEVIPAIPEEDIFDDNKEKRVAVYVRVSTGDPSQTSSYELQKNHYLDVVSRHPNWALVKIYADEGITGTSLNHREAFAEMIEDCYDGKIDLIIAKSVSRFARNTLDCVGHARKLAQMQPPIGILFEAENIFTLDKTSEMALTIVAALAQEESHNKSEAMNASIEMRFRRGIFLTPPLLGYDQGENGNLVINEKEASIVRLIFFMYLYGYTCRQIAETLTNLGCQTKKGNVIWKPGSILGILQNERYCGYIVARKTWTPNYLDHKSKKNKQNRNQYRSKGKHEAIISKEDFIAVHHFIRNAKYGNNRFLPELKVIKQGVLSGFVTIHPRWAGFKAKDYITAAQSVSDNDETPYKNSIELSDGEFDFSGYEIARSQFFNTAGKLFVSVSNKNLMFSTGCVNKFPDTQYIEILISPQKYLIAVRPSSKDKKLSVKWSKEKDSGLTTRTVSGAAFLSTIYEIFDWNLSWKYRIQGTYYSRANMPVIIFDINDTETLMPDIGDNPNDISPLSTAGKSIIAYPTEWIHDFGYNFYTHAQVKELENFAQNGTWDACNEGESFIKDDTPHIPDRDEIDKRIRHSMNEIKGENQNG